MPRTASRLIVLLLALSPALALAEEPVDLEMVSRIRDEGYRRSQVMETARHLTEGIGARLTGSPEMKEANEWTRRKLEEWGLKNARLEPYYFGHGWTFSRVSVHLLRPVEMPLFALPKAWTPGTEGPVRGPLMTATLNTTADLEKHRGKVAGKVLLTSKPRDLVNEPRETSSRRHSPEELEEILAYEPPNPDLSAAKEATLRRLRFRRELNRFLTEEKVIATIDGSGNDWGLIRVGRGGSIEPGVNEVVPALVLGAEQYNRLHRMVSEGREAEVEVDVRARFLTEDLNAYNTVAEIPGTDPKGEVVLAGAHLDSWHGGTGATDNAAGVAVAMEAVRILKALGVKPRRTIRIGLWSGEEQGLFGAQAYVDRHLGARPEPTDPDQKDLFPYLRDPSVGPFRKKPEHAKLSAYFNLDNGAGRIRGIYTEENAAVVPIFEAWIRPLRDLGVTTVTMDQTASTDHVPFDVAGIPGFQFIQDELDYTGYTHHTNADTFDHLVPDDLKQASVVMATFLYNAAMRPERLPRKHLP
jgi:carboxypeptidase Q